MLANGTRKVHVTGWSNGVASIVSTAELPLSNDLLKTTHMANMPTCHGLQDGSLAVQTTTGTAPYSYQWQTGGTDSLLAGIGAGSYIVTVTDAGGCIVQDTFTLAEPAPLSASITNLGLPAICNNSGSLLALATGGTMPYAFNWDNGTTGAGNGNLGPGDYLLTLVDSNGCEATASYAIAAGDTILVQHAAAICEGDGYAWNGLTLTTDTTLCIVFAQANGCDSTVCLSLMVNPLPQPELIVEGDFCTSEEIVLSTGQHSAYLWSSGETSPTITTNVPGTFAVTVTNDFGCQAYAYITVSPGITFSYAATNSTCSDEPDGIIAVENIEGGVPPYSYSIDGENFFPTGIFENLGGESYQLIVEDEQGCKKETTILLEEPPSFFVDAGEDREIKLGKSIFLHAVTNLANPIVSWQPPDYLDCPNCLSVQAKPVKTIQYEVTVQDQQNCTAVDTVFIFVDQLSNVYVPNAFSPNGDGINDGLTIYADASISLVKSFKIFDRWGALVFENANFQPNDSNLGWDGTIKGKPLQSGVYVFTAEVLRVDGELDAIHGEVTLLR